MLSETAIPQPDKSSLQGWLERPWIWLLGALVAGWISTRTVLAANGGHPAVPLDDAYIHFQYAEAFRSGRFFVYSPGGQPTPGATSLLWPVLLSAAQALGFDGENLIYPAWALGFLSLGLLAHESQRVSRRFLSRFGAFTAGLLNLSFSAYAWFATSGMEVLPFAWILLRSARRAAEWAEQRSGSPWELCALAFAAPLLRPEGALVSLFLGAALLWQRGNGLLGALAWSAPALPPLTYWGFTGQFTSTTALVKWLPLSPYHHQPGLLWRAVADHLRLFWDQILDGKRWSDGFVPEGSRPFALLGLLALATAAFRARAFWHGGFLLILGFGVLFPATYDSFLWNRLRYLWPFAPPFLIGLAALTDQLGTWFGRVHRAAREVRWLIAGLLVQSLLSKWPYALSDLATSAAAIQAQQVSLGHWAKTHLPPKARIGVNDTGAIAYFSDHRIFDIVGLTTQSEAPFWIHGPGARFEHYERLDRAELPSHFIVYPEWFGIPALLGRCLTERVVPWGSILGGARKVACEADYSRLGSGQRPQRPPWRERKPIDVLDVADLKDEAAHDYTLLPARPFDTVVVSTAAWLDGARLHRDKDEFRITLEPGGMLVGRLGMDHSVRLRFSTETHNLGEWDLPADPSVEVEVPIPLHLPRGLARVQVESVPPGQLFSSLHYWSYPRPNP